MKKWQFWAACLGAAVLAFSRGTRGWFEFCKIHLSDQFRKLVPRYSGLLALGAGHLSSVYRKEGYTATQVYLEND